MEKHLQHFFLFLGICSLAVTHQSCYRMRSSSGGGEKTTFAGQRQVNPADIALPAGYRIEALATGLTFPSACTEDADGNLYVIETGYSYGEVWDAPRLLRIGNGGTATPVATGGKNGPWTGVAFHNGNFYVAEGGALEGGKILRISPSGSMTTLAENLPSLGDHHTNGPAVGKDGYIYFGQGTATNSGVVGPDNAEFGWLYRKPGFHDIPCRDVTLAGKNYESLNPLTSGDPKDKATTGAYVPYGTATTPGQRIPGRVPCTGSVMRIPLAGGAPELVAWGLRNPFGLAFGPENQLYITENGYDDRGSRPSWGTGDYLYRIEHGQWYGWPDFAGGIPLNSQLYHVPKGSPAAPLLQEHPNQPPKPVAALGVHSSSNGLDFSRSEAFGYRGQAFIAQFGDMAPKVGKVLEPVGFKVVRVDLGKGTIEDFAVNNHADNGPASRLKKGGLERPVSVKFSNDGRALYVVDFGVMLMSEKGPAPQKGTGVVWKITKQ